MSPKERGNFSEQRLMERINSRANKFRLQGQRIDKERADVARRDLKLFDDLYHGPCTVFVEDQAPFAIYQGEVWITGMSKEAYLRGLRRHDDRVRKLTDREIVAFWEKFSGKLTDIHKGFKIQGFREPFSFPPKR